MAWCVFRQGLEERCPKLPEFLSEAVSPIAQLEAQKSVAVLLEHNKDLQAHPMRKALEAQTVGQMVKHAT